MLASRKSISDKRPESKRVPELDGLRGLAILLVILHHRFPDHGLLRRIGEAGWIGVDLFFVLSGYLITGILLDAVGKPYYYRNFIARRTLRIFPLYYLCLVLFIAATRLSANAELWNSLQRWGGAGWFAFYLGNFRIAWVNAMPPIFSLTPLWSLQVEEQFYVLFPLVVSLLSIQNLRRMLVGCVIAAPLLRICLTLFVPGSAEACYVLMPCRMDALALGALLAASSHSRPALFPNGFFMRLGGAMGGIAILVAVFFGWLDLHSPFVRSVGYSMIDLVFAVVLATVISLPGSNLTALLRQRPLVYTGKISYGLYLLHVPASWIALKTISRLASTDVQRYWIVSIPITFAASFLAAAISWRFLEGPMVRLKERVTATFQLAAEGKAIFSPASN